MISFFSNFENLFDCNDKIINKIQQTTKNLIIVRLINESSFKPILIKGKAKAQTTTATIIINTNFQSENLLPSFI